MTRLVLIGICAGLISAVLFASAAAGPLYAKFLFYLITSLPLFLVGLSFGWIAAAIGGIVGAIVLAVIATPHVGMAFGATQCIPPILLCYLAQLSRTTNTPNSSQTTTEWYPVGRIVLWAAALSAALTIATLLMMGQDLETLQATLRKAVEQLVQQQVPKGDDGNKLSADDITKITEVVLALMPAFLAISIMGIMLINLWLAARIAMSFGRLYRPWPYIPALTYPTGTPLALAASLIAASLLTGYAGLAASAISGALYFAYVLLGLAIIHFVSRKEPWQPMLLFFVYAGLVIANTFVSPVIAIIGLAEPFSPLKRNKNTPFPPQPPGSGPPPTT